MSQKSTRKLQNATSNSEEKEKRQVDSPVKEMKKKLAANAEKEKHAAEKTDKIAEKNDKPVEKPGKAPEKPEKPLDKPVDKSDKPVDKGEKPGKNVDKPDKSDKKPDKPAEMKAEVSHKNDDAKGDKNAKDKASPAKVNGSHNGTGAASGATVSDSEDDLVIEEDEAFPELTYDDSDTDAFETDAGRSLTRRSQVKVTKTPETPRPVSVKDSDDSKESKVLKLSDTPTSDRKLRSADSPKPDPKKTEPGKKGQDKHTDNKDGQEEKSDASKKDPEAKTPKQDKQTDKSDKIDVDITVEAESSEGDKGGKCHARVSPYTRVRHDVTVCSNAANYTGNNTTMEMDITETSLTEEELNDSSYLQGLRTIRGRSSYKKLADLPPIPKRSAHRAVTSTLVAESRPLGAVVGRKRKPSPELAVETATEAAELLAPAPWKRPRLFDRLALPFKRRAAEIVGINTDLSLTAPVAPTSAFDPETIKPPQDISPHLQDISQPLTQERDSKRCVVM